MGFGTELWQTALRGGGRFVWVAFGNFSSFSPQLLSFRRICCRMFLALSISASYFPRAIASDDFCSGCKRLSKSCDAFCSSSYLIHQESNVPKYFNETKHAEVSRQKKINIPSDGSLFTSAKMIILLVQASFQLLRDSLKFLELTSFLYLATRPHQRRELRLVLLHSLPSRRGYFVPRFSARRFLAAIPVVLLLHLRRMKPVVRRRGMKKFVQRHVD